MTTALCTAATAQPADGRVTLQLLHASDFEANTDAITDAPNFATIVDALDDAYPTTLIISSGDNFIPSPFSAAAGTTNAAVQAALSTALNEVMSRVTGSTYESLEAEPGRIDIAILNAIGLDAAAVGNHDMDFGQQQLFNNFAEATNDTPDTKDDSWVGALFPYLSSNLELGAESVLRGAYDADGVGLADDRTGVLAPFTIIRRNGELFGVIGATTQILEEISSTTGDPDNPNDDVTVSPERDDMAALAAAIQPIVDRMEAAGIDKIIVATHLQQLDNEKALAPLLRGVDIIVGGGSNTRLADAGDRLREGDEAQGPYPILEKDADGNDIAIVNTEGNYTYVGRLVVTFDENGHIDPSSIDESVSGAYATDEEGVLAVTGAADLASAISASTKGSEVKRLADAVGDAILATSGTNFFADQSADLNGERQPGVRTEETNLGNLTADANLWYANQMSDEPVIVSLKNGGGIRAGIPNDDGKISELEISGALAFNNALSLVTLTPEALLALLNHGVAASTFDADGIPTNAQGRFPQVAGLRFSFDPAKPEGAKVEDVWLVGVGPGDADGEANGEADVKIVEDGALTPAAADHGAIRTVTLGFLLSGGDGYPYGEFVSADAAAANVVDLYNEPIIADGAAQFTNVGTEQDALAEYLAATYGVDTDASTDFAVSDTPAADDERIINLGLPGKSDSDG